MYFVGRYLIFKALVGRIVKTDPTNLRTRGLGSSYSLLSANNIVSKTKGKLV